MSYNLYNLIKEYIVFDNIENFSKKYFIQFIEAFEDKVFDRENLVGHITVSSWIVNPLRTKVLMAHHNLYNSFGWLGGHNNSDNNLLRVCLKEISEDCGISDVKVLSTDIFDIEVCPVARHIKRGIEIPNHLYYNVTFLIEINESHNLVVKEDENSALKWIKNEDILNVVQEENMKYIYKRLMKKVNLR